MGLELRILSLKNNASIFHPNVGSHHKCFVRASRIRHFRRVTTATPFRHGRLVVRICVDAMEVRLKAQGHLEDSCAPIRSIRVRRFGKGSAPPTSSLQSAGA